VLALLAPSVAQNYAVRSDKSHLKSHAIKKNPTPSGRVKADTANDIELNRRSLGCEFPLLLDSQRTVPINTNAAKNQSPSALPIERYYGTKTIQQCPVKRHKGVTMIRFALEKRQQAPGDRRATSRPSKQVVDRCRER